VEDGETLRALRKGFNLMSISRWIVLAAALILSFGLLAAGGSSAEPAPRLVGNPFYRVSVTNVDPTTASAAANVPAVISTGATLQHVVYPSSTTSNWTPANPASANDGGMQHDVAPFIARALPRNRAAALGAALRVTKLAEAYPANAAAVDMPPAPTQSMPARQVAASSIEPPRFAPAPNVAQMPNGNTVIAGTRYDAAVRPAAWSSNVASDAPTYRNPATSSAEIGSQQAGNPLRSVFAEGQAIHPHSTLSNASSGNPLR